MRVKDLRELLEGCPEDLEVRVAVTLGDYSRTEVSYGISEEVEQRYNVSTGYSRAYGGEGAAMILRGEDEEDDHREEIDGGQVELAIVLHLEEQR